jgi:predicted nucleic acid-binding protein
MSPPHFLDTNVLLYSISRDPGRAAKRARAEQLLDDDNGALSVQVLQEFYVTGDPKNAPGCDPP